MQEIYNKRTMSFAVGRKSNLSQVGQKSGKKQHPTQF